MRDRGLLRYVGKRILFLPVAIIVVLTLAFAIVNLTPGNPAVVIGGELASDELIAEIESELGLDQPLHERYWEYITGVLTLDLGESYFSQRPIIDEIRYRLPNSLELVILSLSVAALIGLANGALGARYRGGWIDRTTRGITSVFQSVPDFFIGILLIYLLYYQLNIAPAPVGRLGLLETQPPQVTGGLFVDALIAGQWDTFLSLAAHAVLPVLTLGLFYSAYFAKVSRTLLIDALGSKQVEFARALGLRNRTQLLYAFRQARTPIITYGAILFAALVGGGAIVETIFAWGGLGQWAIDSILKLDIPAIQGFILITGLVTLATYLLLDVLTIALDPRIAVR